MRHILATDTKPRPGHAVVALINWATYWKSNQNLASCGNDRCWLHNPIHNWTSCGIVLSHWNQHKEFISMLQQGYESNKTAWRDAVFHGTFYEQYCTVIE